MSNKTNNNNLESNNVSESIKETAGSAFHAVHGALEATENAAMSAVDATAGAINDLKENDNNKRKNQ